ncbi:MAG: Smr/MutS family protein, partial [Gammaproteobacteria bacterium]|nr:Smr/MutS family protein [Gammaproteobacteria bacterium]
ECRYLDQHCVRIVHGKGKRSGKAGPVLKQKVCQWLRHRDNVLAFTTAPRSDGGAGALYVLLR